MYGHLNILCMYVTPSEQLSSFPTAQEQRHRNYFLCKDILIQRNA